MPPAEAAPAADRSELCSRLLYGPGTWFELCRGAAGDPAALAGLTARLADHGDAAQALANRASWPGRSRLAQAEVVGSALSAARAATAVTALLTSTEQPAARDATAPAPTATEQPGAPAPLPAPPTATWLPQALDDRVRDAAAHWRRANVLPTLPLTGAGIATDLPDPGAAAAARRLAVIADDATPAGRASIGYAALLVRALTPTWPGKRREVELPVLFDRRSTGGHGVLRLTLLGGGPPGLYPDPRAMLFLVADRRFAAALDAAWATAAPLHGRCVVWRLTTDGLACDEVAGGSLGAAFGVGLADLSRRTPPLLRARRLDRRCAITAELRPDARLAPVGGIRNKLEEAIRLRLRVVLAPPGDADAVPGPLLRDARVRFAGDLAAAVRACRTRMNPSFAALLVAVVLAASGVAGGALAAARGSRAAHLREVAAGLPAAAADIRQTDPAGALLLEALAVRLGAPGARNALVQSVLANRYAGTLPDADYDRSCGPQTWSPDGTRVATLRHREGMPSELRLWDTARPGLDRAITVGGQVSGCAFAPDGRTVALAVDGRLALLPLDRQAAPSITGHPAHQVQFAPSGLLATAAEGQPVGLWSVADIERPRRLATIPATITGSEPPMAFSADSRTLVFGEYERVVIADLTRPDRPRIAATLPAGSNCLALSSTGTLAVGRYGGDIELWDVRKPSAPQRADRVRSRSRAGLSADTVAFTPDGSQLVAAAGGTAEVWRIGDSAPEWLRFLHLGAGQVTGADLSPDGRTALVRAGSGGHSLWRVADRESPPAITTLPLGTAHVTGLAFLPGGRLLVTASGGAATLWDAADPARPRRLRAVGPRDGRGTPGSSLPAVFSADGRTYAAPDDDGGIGLWTVGSLHRTGSIPRLDDDALSPLALSPDGSLLAAVPGKDPDDPEKPVRLWETRDQPRLVAELPAGPRPVAAFTPDGRTLATVTHDVATWWNVADPARPAPAAQRRFTVGEHPGSVVFSADGRLMVATVGTGPGLLWDTSDPADPTLLATQPPLHGGSGMRAVLHRDTLILSAVGAMNVWDVSDPAHPAEATAFASADDNPFYEHVAVAPNGLMATAQIAGGFLTGHYTNTSVVQLRDLSPILEVLADPVTVACRMAGRDLGPELWQRFAPDLPPRPVCH
ncbi:hypothetical protein [Actinoplanes aureus]|uniref:Uncharacterized protein n=1 Tax=Actinoplanes aureus TaxID=2792083 RepID=A0A931CDX5_9ACTN|nr:hypothetical protein [Actinoplanes aureus]MBG0564378.1 hypothetical protein [Actinoplanes aureus]